MFALLFAALTALVAWNYWSNQGLYRLFQLHRRAAITLGILLGGAFLYFVCKFYPRHLQHTIQFSQRYIPANERASLQPLFDAANEFAGTTRDAPRNRYGIVPTARRVSESMKKQVAAAQQWRCAMCQAMLPGTYEVDHILRLEFGGSNEHDNLQALCPNCHRHKTVMEASATSHGSAGAWS